MDEIMTVRAKPEHRSILIIDDNLAIHEDFRKILSANKPSAKLDDMAEFLLGVAPSDEPVMDYELHFAAQGQEGFEMVSEAVEEGNPFALAFVDMRMPPGWDGLETIEHLWRVQPDLQIVICTAYSDHSWNEITQRLRPRDRLLILKKPFDNVEVCQLAASLTEKFHLSTVARLKMEQLEQLVADRTSELRREIAEREKSDQALRAAEEQLRQAQKMEAIGHLAGGIAHEFNNLLQVIQGYTSYAQEGLEPDDPRYANLQQVIHAVDRAAAITEQLLRFGRKQPLDRAAHDPNQLISGLVQMLSPLFGAGIQVHTDLTEVKRIVADAALVQQVLMNLCLNARDAMPHGGSLWISTHERIIADSNDLNLTPGDYVEISVRDEGTGIPPELCHRIFEPFFTTKTVGRGTGLGLATAYGIVKQHGGEIEVESHVGQGSTFRVLLRATSQIPAGGASERTATGTGGGETILLAEDETSLRFIMARMLRKAGYNVLEASDGEEALELFRQNADHIGLTLLDSVMPKVGGRAAFEEIRRHSPQAKIAFCSGYSAVHAGEELPFDDRVPLIRKPFRREVLLKSVRAALDGVDLATSS
jgi:two-component system NtrC family sensor kinase